MPIHLIFLLLIAHSLVLPGAFVPDAAQSHSSVTLVQVVNPRQSVIEWAPPAAIPVGEALSSAQLAATASTTGSFSYTPTAGALLQPGVQTLSVVFTPDSPNFLPATASVQLTVEGPGNSTFAVNFPNGGATPAPIQLNSQGSASLTLSIAPVADFQQPVSFSCIAPSQIACSFTPASVRPTTAPVSVVFNIQYTPSVEARSKPPHLPGGHLPTFACVALFCVALGRRRAVARLAQLGAFAMMLIVLGSLTACGSGKTPAPVLSVQLTASSVVQTQSIQLSVVLPSPVS